MSAIHCKLLYQSTSPHLQQLYTGFLMLHRNGAIRLSQTSRRTPITYGNSAPHLKEAGHAHLDAVINGSLRLHFDTHDSLEIAMGEIDQCDFYFKRSYSSSLIASLPTAIGKKILPLGLNYRVLPDNIDPFALRRAFCRNGISRDTFSAVRQALDTGNRQRFEPRLAAMESQPDLTANPKVLFLVAAYDPYDDPDRSQEKIEDRIQINETRARCIRLLTDALGPRFTGGFSHSGFSTSKYGDLVAPASMTSQDRYLRTVRSFPICVATTGLHGSIGWKLAEYVALSKAIVSESLVHQVPGEFTPGKNYLEFKTPDECVAAAIRLVEDGSVRETIMRNNAAYYHSHLRPDILVKNAIDKAMELSGAWR